MTLPRILLSPPELTGHELAGLESALDSGWIAPVGPDLDAFEGELAAVAGTRHALGLASGTAALHLALKVAGVGPGDTVLCPTLTASESIARYAGWTPGEDEPTRIRQARALLARALESGVTIGCGSDVGVFRHGDNVRELELMVDFGMPPLTALQSATSIAADVLDRPDLGRLRPGATADLIAVRGNPLEDISVLRRPVLVVKEGEVVFRR